MLFYDLAPRSLSSFTLKCIFLWNKKAIWNQTSYGAYLGNYNSMVQVTWPKWLPCSYMVKILNIPLLQSQMVNDLGNLVSSIGHWNTIKLVQMMTLGWPWLILWRGQIWFLGLLTEKMPKTSGNLWKWAIEHLHVNQENM